MANNIAALLITLFSAARVVPKELTGFLGAIDRDFDDKQVHVGGTVKIPVVPTLTVGSIPAASMSFSAGADRTPSTIDFTLSQTAQVTFNLTGEENRALENSQTAQEVFRQTIEQGFRSIRNQIESYLGTIAKNSASRALGTAGTTPFASDFNLFADTKKELNINGAGDGRAIILNSNAIANLSKLSALYKVNEAGGEDLLRNGVMGRLQGFDIRETAGIATHTKGTGTGYLVNAGGGLAVGTTTIPLDTGSGTIVAGDVIAIAGDANKYVVKTALTGGNVVIQEPGLRAAAADNAAVTVENNYTGNIALHRSAIKAVIRPIDQPQSADIEQAVITDPETKFSVLVIRKVGDQMTSWYMRAVYDAIAVNPYGIITVRG